MNLNAFTDNNLNKKCGFLFLVAYLSFAVYSIIAGLIVNALKITGNVYYIFSSLPIMLSVITTLLLAPKENRITKNAFNAKFKAIYYVFAVILAFAMLFGFGFTNGLVELFFNKLGVFFNSNSPKVNNLLDYVILTVFVAIIPAVFEEILFRGILLKNLNARPMFCVLVSALCFSFYHGSVVKLLYQFIFGVMLALIFYSSKSLIPCIIAHFFNNFIILTFYFVGINALPMLWWVVLLGIVLASVIFIFTLKKVKSYSVDNNGEIKDFFIPYGLLALCATLVTILGGIV